MSSPAVALYLLNHDESWTERDYVSPDEERRALSYRYPQDQHRFRLIRSHVRRLLARHLNEEASALTIECSSFGKPTVDGIAFSVSHSAGHSILAIREHAPFEPLGIDFERIVPENVSPELSARCLGEAELRDWKRLPESEQVDAFYQYWTLKEAYLKALGTGFKIEPTLVDTKNPGYATAPGLTTLQVSLLDSPIEGYALAICGLGPLERHLACWMDPAL
ncbi:MAG: 4'-phosphopantetheinyl transferase superfamily protein [Verrucomicrobiota bacterium JB023]|nr:4'-phosphopantetheinyl transferase superfamily protein [Verrucomicrobiota bacterium JB023]